MNCYLCLEPAGHVHRSGARVCLGCVERYELDFVPDDMPPEPQTPKAYPERNWDWVNQ